MPAETYKKLGQVALQSTPTTIYSPPGSPPDTVAIVKEIHIVNVSGVSTSVQIWQGGSANVNQILPATSLAAGEYGSGEGAVCVAQGDTLVGQCTANNDVTVTIEGVEIS